MLSQTFLSSLFIALSTVDASPLIHRNGGMGTLALSRRFHFDKASGSTFLERDRARALATIPGNSLSKRSDASVTITNDAVLGAYSVQVSIGEPARNYTLLVDTGSSNTWVGANVTNPYIRTNTSVATGNTFNISYGSGNVTGYEFLDTVMLSSDLVIEEQSIGVASSTGFGLLGLDGIIGLGPVDLTLDTVSNTATVPTVMDNLYSQGSISEQVLGIYFVPSAENVTYGELTLGGYDRSVTTSPIEYVPLTTTNNASRYWGVNQSVSYGDEIIQSNAAGIVDTGTTLVLLETNAFQKYQNATGGVLDESTGLLAISAAQYSRLKLLSFNIGGVCLDLTPNAQIWPRSLNSAIGGNANAIYLIVNDLGPVPGIDFGFITGYTFLERYYSVFDTTNKRIGFAKTAYTESVTN